MSLYLAVLWVQFVSMLVTKGSAGKSSQHRKVLDAFQGSLSLLTTVCFSPPFGCLAIHFVHLFTAQKNSMDPFLTTQTIEVSWLDTLD